MTHINFYGTLTYKTDHLIPARRPDIIIIKKKKKKKRICKIVDFVVPLDHRINQKESEKKDKYLDLARELKKLWNMKVTIVPILIGALGTITKGGLESWRTGRELSKRQHCWERTESWDDSRTVEETCCHSDSREKSSANADVKISNE